MHYHDAGPISVSMPTPLNIFFETISTYELQL